MGGIDKMTNVEIATYLGMANVMLSEEKKNMDDKSADEMWAKIRSALCYAQIEYFNKSLIDLQEVLNDG